MRRSKPRFRPFRGVACVALVAGELDAQTLRESVDGSGAQANGASTLPATSGDGRFVTFMSTATHLVPEDRFDSEDVFLRDRATGAIELISATPAGVPGNDRSSVSAVTPDGRYVAFSSEASDLVASDTNQNWDVFRRDRVTGTTIQVSVSSAGIGGDAGSVHPTMSADGRYVAFHSLATNLVSGDGNGVADVFWHDCDTGETRRVSKTNSGGDPNNRSQTPSISADGMLVAYHSEASNIGAGFGRYAIYVHDLRTDTTKLVSLRAGGGIPAGDSYWPSISADGRFVCFYTSAPDVVADDSNGAYDVFVRDRVLATTLLASRTPAGATGNGASQNCFLARDGLAVVFDSFATDLVAGDTNEASDVFVCDLLTGVVERASVRTNGSQAEGASSGAAISDHADTVFFGSLAADLVDGDTNGVSDVFSTTREVELARWSRFGAGWPGTLGVPAIALDSEPVIGTTRSVQCGSSSPFEELAVLLVGYERASIPSLKDGTFLVDPISYSTSFLLPPGGTGVPFEIAFEPWMIGFSFVLQSVQTDAGASKGVAFSEGIEAFIGY